MKNNILFMVCVILFAFTSCTSSEEIEINDIQSKYQAVFKINPSTVVEPFTWQIHEGELSTIPSGNKLRVRALIYDGNGVLVHEHSEQFSNYNVLMDFSAELEKGEYTLIAISDVINPNPGEGQTPEFWILGDCQHLNETKITSANMIGEQREILGVVNKKISISSVNNEYIIDIKPAGAVIYTLYNDILYFDDIKRYQLNINQVAQEFIFDSNGNPTVSVVENNNNEFKWRLNIAYPDYDPQYVYIINYVLPQNNLRLRFAGYTHTGLGDDKEGSGHWLGKELHVPSINAGDQFYFKIDVAHYDTGVEYGKVNGLTYPNTNSSRAFLKESFNRGNVLYLKDFE